MERRFQEIVGARFPSVCLLKYQSEIPGLRSTSSSAMGMASKSVQSPECAFG